MRRINVGIADYAVSNDPGACLVTVGLGSCVAVIAYDLDLHVGGMCHIKLPTSRLDPLKAEQKPATFVDTGLNALFQGMQEHGCKRRGLTIKIAGGASMYDDGGLFSVGERNIVAVRRALWKDGLFITGHSVGGSAARTVLLHVGSGRCLLRTGREEFLL